MGGSVGPGVSVDELYALVTSTHSYSELSRELLENVLDMLDGRYPSQEFGELRARIVWDRVAGTILLGASTWRIEEIGRDRVIVTPAPGAPGAVPFWKGDSVGRPKELGEAIGAFSRWAVEQDANTLQRDYDLDERAARNLLAYLREQQPKTLVPGQPLSGNLGGDAQ